ncbi:hypothetical protein CRG98_024708, partial [Punica granatum]
DLLTRASYLSSFAISSRLLARASCNLAGSAHLCEFTFLLRKFVEPARSCLLQPCRIYSPVRVIFLYSQVRRTCSLVPLTTLQDLLTRASYLSIFASSSNLLARASYNLAGSTHPCELSFYIRKFVEPARSCLLQPCRIYSPVRVIFLYSQVRRTCSLVPLTTLQDLLTRASYLSIFASSSNLLARASYNLAGSTHPCELSFYIRKFVEPARSCLLQPCRIYSPVRVIFLYSQVRRTCSLVPLTTLQDLLTRASLLFCFESSSTMLARASYNLAGSTHPCELSFYIRKFVEAARSCLLQPCGVCSHQPCRVCSPVRVYFSPSKVRRACSLVPLATLTGLLTRASLLFCLGGLPSLLAPPSCNPAGSAHPSEFTILLLMFAGLPRSCLLHPCRVCSPMRVYFSPSKVRRACSLLLLVTLPGLLTDASLLFSFESSPSLLAPPSCNPAGSAHRCEFTFLLRKFAEPARSSFFSPSLLAFASCNLAGSAHPSEFTFVLRKFAEPARFCLLQPCRVCSPVRVYFCASQVRRACSPLPLTILSGLLTHASLLFYFGTSSLSQLARASCNVACSVSPSVLTFPLSKFAEPARLCLLQRCQKVPRACSLVPLATLSGLLTRASLLFCLASSPSMLARASSNLAGSAHPCELSFLLRKFVEPARSCLLQPCRVCSPPGFLARASCIPAGSAHPCEFTFMLRKFAEPARSSLLQPCRVCSPVRVYYSASHVSRASSLVPLASLPGLLTRASLLLCFASSPSLLAPPSCNPAGSAHQSEFTILLLMFAGLPRSCLLHPYRVCSPVRVYFSASQVRRACSRLPLATLEGLLTRASLHFCTLAGSANPCELTFLHSCRHRKFAEPARSSLLQPCRVCSPVRVYYSASHVSRASSLVPLASLPGLLTRASLLFCFASSLSMLARASYNLAGSAHPCELSFLLRKFVEPARSCLLQPCRVCSPVRVYYSASHVSRASSLVPLASLPGLLTRASLLFCFASSLSMLARASYNLAGSAHPCELSFLLRKFVEPARSCLLQPCRQVRRACSLVPLATLSGLLTRASLLFCLASSLSILARASSNLAGSAHPCELSFLLCKFVEPARSCLLQPCRVCSPVRVYFSALKVRRACSLVPLATLPGLLTRASLLFCLASSPSLLAPPSCNPAGSAHPSEFTILLLMFAGLPRSCLLHPYRVCSPVRVYFSASQVRRACSLLPLATVPGLLTRASLLFRLESSPSLLARASSNLAGSAHPCQFTFLLSKFVEHARSCLLQPCTVCSPVRVIFPASPVRRGCSLVPLATLLGLLTRASLLFYLESSPSLLARASCNLAGSAHPCEFTFLLSKFIEHARSFLLQPCRIYSPVRVIFPASPVRRGCSLVPLATLLGLLTRASLLFCFESSPSLLARTSCNLAGSAHPCEFTFLLRKFAEPARSYLLQPCWVCSPIKFPEPARSCLLQPCRLRKFVEAARSCLLQPCWFNPGDLILRKVLHVTPDSRGKFLYKYDGPFVVKETFSGGAVILSDIDGTENALPVNAVAIKKYYP